MGRGLLQPWLRRDMPGRRGLGGWILRLSVGLTGRLGLGMLLRAEVGLVVGLREGMPRLRRGLRHRFGLWSGRNLLGVLRLLACDRRHGLGLGLGPGLAWGC